MDPRSYARSELRKAVRRLERVKKGRSFALESVAEAMGPLVARGWLAPGDLSKALLAASATNGLASVDSRLAMQAVIHAGLARGLKHPHPDLEPDRWDQVLATVKGDAIWHDEKGRPIEKVATRDVLVTYLGIPASDHIPVHHNRLSKAMARLGWTKAVNGMRFGHELHRGYWRLVQPSN